MPCLDCRKNHGIWSSPKFNHRKVADRGNFAKHNQVFFQYFAQGHQGKAFPRHFTAKMLVEQMSTAVLDWVKELTEPLTNAAQAWFSELPELTQLQIPQSLLLRGKQIDNVSLHTFVNASKSAFGAAAYVRYSYQDETTSTTSRTNGRS